MNDRVSISPTQIGLLAEQETPWDSQCYACARYDRESAGEFRCAAFPGGIPTVILYNRFDHRQPFEGDQGIGFEGYEGHESPFVSFERYDARKLAEAQTT